MVKRLGSVSLQQKQSKRIGGLLAYCLPCSFCGQPQAVTKISMLCVFAMLR